MATNFATSWDQTLLAQGHEQNELSLKDIKQLLLNRGESKQNLKGLKKELILSLIHI